MTHGHDHEHDHGNGHDHALHYVRATSEPELRVKALEALLVERGLVSTDAIDAVIDTYEHRIGPHIGARFVARWWSDPDFASRARASGAEALLEMGHGGMEGYELVCVENTPEVHNVIVCTLCSCYPWPVLGLPPIWYKSAAYRSRVVAEPRSVLAEFGTSLPADVRVRVYDSTSEVRYLVIPRRPAGTEDWAEDQLAEIVTRDAMVGVACLADVIPA
jgi:nitrile hydratase